MARKNVCVYYARKEPTTDDTLRNHNPKWADEVYDVQIYRDRKAKERWGRFMWDTSSKPTRRSKKISISGAICELRWLPDKKRRK
jgi:hypothetical protein